MKVIKELQSSVTVLPRDMCELQEDIVTKHIEHMFIGKCFNGGIVSKLIELTEMSATYVDANNADGSGVIDFLALVESIEFMPNEAVVACATEMNPSGSVIFRNDEAQFITWQYFDKLTFPHIKEGDKIPFIVKNAKYSPTNTKVVITTDLFKQREPYEISIRVSSNNKININAFRFYTDICKKLSVDISSAGMSKSIAKLYDDAVGTVSTKKAGLKPIMNMNVSVGDIIEYSSKYPNMYQIIRSDTSEGDAIANNIPTKTADAVFSELLNNYYVYLTSKHTILSNYTDPKKITKLW